MQFTMAQKQHRSRDSEMDALKENLVGLNYAKQLLVGLHACAMDCDPRVQLIHICMPV